MLHFFGRECDEIILLVFNSWLLNPLACRWITVYIPKKRVITWTRCYFVIFASIWHIYRYLKIYNLGAKKLRISTTPRVDFSRESISACWSSTPRQSPEAASKRIWHFGDGFPTNLRFELGKTPLLAILFKRNKGLEKKWCRKKVYGWLTNCVFFQLKSKMFVGGTFEQNTMDFEIHPNLASQWDNTPG